MTSVVVGASWMARGAFGSSVVSFQQLMCGCQAGHGSLAFQVLKFLKIKVLQQRSVSTQSVRDLRESSVPEQGSTEVF